MVLMSVIRVAPRFFADIVEANAFVASFDLGLFPANVNVQGKLSLSSHAPPMHRADVFLWGR